MAWVRHGVYWVPGGALGAWGASWLGWDLGRGAEVVQPEVPGLPRPLADLTAEPRRYGLHATLKPPFRLAEGTEEAALSGALARLAAGLGPVRLRLRLARQGRFLALVPEGGEDGPRRVADAAVAALDGFRAPATHAELARRRAGGLSGTQEANLVRWGYPFVMDEFRLHVTLTGPLATWEAEAAERALAPLLAPVVAEPQRLDALAHVAEGEDGRFRLVARHPLRGAAAS